MTDEVKVGEDFIFTKDDVEAAIPQILEDILMNLIRDVVVDVHRSEKMLRMTSVAVQAERLALQAAGAPPTPTTTNLPQSKPSVAPVQTPQVKIDVPGGYYENGKVFLRGNPLKTVKDIYCPHCKLPRLLFPVTGIGARLPDDLNRQYCTLHPFIQKPGHDIYGNPFPIDQTNKTKRERELIKKAEKADRDNTPGSGDTNEDGTHMSAEQVFMKKLTAGAKPASYVPWHTCPSCKRSLLITKFAQHLDKCLGIGGRAARNTAAARLSGMNGSASGSVQGSRVGTPTPSSQGNGNKKDQDEDEEEAPPKKKPRKEKKEKIGKEKITIKLGTSKMKGDAAANRTSKAGAGPTSNPDKSKGDDTSGSKREREDGSEEAATAAPRKKMKLTTESSTGSP